jgi:glycosyltransferase involved in cell wall biosynthesis
MKVLQINSSDVIGSRFNGFDIRELLANEGVTSHHLVWNKISSDPASSLFFPIPGSRHATAALARIERKLSIHARLQLQSFSLPLHRQFKEADLIHYHIVHDGFFGLAALPWLSRLKPSVWTIHDPWLMTGHCIYPVGCERWRLGCGDCPRLDLPFAMRRDRTAEDFKWKQGIVRQMNVEFIFASDSMLRMAQQSAIAKDKPAHVIPFGINLQRFTPGNSAAARKRLGVAPDRLVISVRAFPKNPFKGFECFVEALRRLDALQVPLTIITTHSKGHLNEFIGKHQIIELGWVNDESVMLDSYRAADMFVMPSPVEAFGMMAIEAMACGKPIIVFDGTSLPDVTHAPDIGVAVPNGDIGALASAIEMLALREDERLNRGAAGRALAERLYDERIFAERLADLYKSVGLSRHDNAERES